MVVQEENLTGAKLKGHNIDKPFFLSGGIEPGMRKTLKEFIKNLLQKTYFQ